MSAGEFIVEPIELSGQRHFGETRFPYAFSCQSPEATAAQAEHWLSARRHEVLELASQHGAVFFRGFPTPSAEAFDGLVRALELPNFPYEESLSNAVRSNRTERVFSANEAPPEVGIFFHHEMAQTPIYPRWILFYCEVAAEEGGASPICRSDVLYEALAQARPDFIRDCESKGLRYSNVMPRENDVGSGMGRSWRDTLGVQTASGAEERLSALGYEWIWEEDDCLRVTSPPLPGIKTLSPGRKSFFNQLIAAYKGWKDDRNDPSSAIRHGDGTKLNADAVADAIQLAEELAFDLLWQAQDFAIVDNRLVMHARGPFRGVRRVFASLAGMEKQSFLPAQ